MGLANWLNRQFWLQSTLAMCSYEKMVEWVCYRFVTVRERNWRRLDLNSIGKHARRCDRENRGDRSN